MSHQRKFPLKHAKDKKFAVLEGRDIGTVIFPSAKYKIFSGLMQKLERREGISKR